MEPIVAAGAVVTREANVLLVHRPKYDDWSFPKGKVDPGEHVTATAVREVAEETGLNIRLGPPLHHQSYPVGKRTKIVHYWAGRLMGSHDVSTYAPNAEIDEVAWVPIEQARERLTYPYDVATLAEIEAVPTKTTTLVVLRHGKALPRSEWEGDDRDRPLVPAGELQAKQLVPVFAAYGVQRVVSSSSRRCWTTVAAYAHEVGSRLEMTDDLTEQDATAEAVATQVHGLLDAKEPALLCTHREVLPLIFEALGAPDPGLEPGAMCVVHHRAGHLVAVEHHPAI